jgi:hypothetical protein
MMPFNNGNMAKVLLAEENQVFMPLEVSLSEDGHEIVREQDLDKVLAQVRSRAVDALVVMGEEFRPPGRLGKEVVAVQDVVSEAVNLGMPVLAVRNFLSDAQFPDGVRVVDLLSAGEWDEEAFGILRRVLQQS